MKRVMYIWLLMWPLLNKAQTACLPDYGMPVKRQRVLDKYELAYVEKGKGKTVVLVHGLGGNISHWTHNIKVLSRAFRCIAIDLPGYGHSSKNIYSTTNNILSLYAEALNDFIQKKNLKDVTMVGHSMGGQIAMIAALKYPLTISHLVLLAPAGLETFTAQEATILTNATQPSMFINQDEAGIRASFGRNFYKLPAQAEKLIQERLKLKKCNEVASHATVVSTGVQGMLQQPVKDQLKNIRQPVLIIYGQQDALIPNKFLHPALSITDVVKMGTDYIPNVQSKAISNAGHLVQFEQPEETNKAIINFIK